jgi:hypothetical protein
MQCGVVRPYTRKVLTYQLTGRDATGPHGSLHIGDAGFDDRETPFFPMICRGLCGNDGEEQQDHE